MSVQLQGVKFNHDSSSASADALNLRRNATEFVTVPEWRHGVSVSAEDSPVCYAQRETTGNTLTIQANLRRLDPSLQSVEVRAVDPTVDPPGPSGCLGLIARIFRAIIRALFGNVLGDLRPRSVTFGANGETGWQTFELQHVRLWSVGVGARTTTWRWQYRTGSSDPWTDFATTNHRIYVVLEVPKSPWQQSPYAASNTQLPWTEVLDYSCSWAILASNADEAATAVTRNVFDLGPSVVEYDCPGGGSTHYAWGSFDCTAFLDRLKGGAGNGRYVNCTDCATILSTFANILGCDLWQSRMGWGFGLNPMLGIGSSIWEPACLSSGHGWTGSFSYHEVAWKGACTSSEEVFDACLKVDGDADPTTAPHTAMLVANLRFGDPGDGVYRDRLATPAGRPSCDPQPTTRTRRSIS
jgi:hypothetical protein